MSEGETRQPRVRFVLQLSIEALSLSSPA